VDDSSPPKSASGSLKRIGLRSPQARERWARRLWWLHSVWALTAGTLVVIYAGRNYEKARWLILLLLAAWLLIVGFYRVFGRRPLEGAESLQKKVGFLVFTYALKNLYQAMIFFLLPFYWRSATLGTSNQWFVLVLGLSGVLATLDLVFDRVLMRWRLVASSYFVITLFAAINLAIPALLPGISASWSLLVASTAAMAAFWTFYVPVRQLLVDRAVQLGFLVAMGGALAAGLALRPVVPPVPHYVLHGAAGRLLVTDRLSEEASGFHTDHLGDLYVQTRVLAPGGADGDFRHVWRHGKTVVLEVTPRYRSMAPDDPSVVTVTSRLPESALPDNPVGKWSVDVLTDDDRLVGRVRFRIYR